jgi:hypothetical protein
MSLTEIIPRTPFTFASAAGTTNEVTLAKYVDTAAFGSAVLILRVHAAPAGGATWTLVAVPTSYADEDPSIDFVGGTALETQLTFPTGSNLAVLALPAAGGTALSAQTRLLLRVTGGTGTQTATFSVQLLGREP